MHERYTHIDGLSFSKGSDREYSEEWGVTYDQLIVRKTINGREVMHGKPQHTLIITGIGDVLPKNTLSIGDTVSVLGPNGVNLLLRFEKWSYKYVPWQFSYSWTYSFIEIGKTP